MILLLNSVPEKFFAKNLNLGIKFNTTSIKIRMNIEKILPDFLTNLSFYLRDKLT